MQSNISTKTSWIRFFTVLLPIVVAASMWSAQSLDAQGVAEKGENHTGICVVVPARDGAELASLTHQGRRLVHGLALDDGQRDRVRTSIFAKKVHGLASVITWPERRRLPYADNLINLSSCIFRRIFRFP